MTDFSPSWRKVPYEAYPEMSLMTLGARSYLVGGVGESYTTDAHILVGNYSSLAHNLHFYLGLSHNHRAVTSYPMSVLTGAQGNEHAAYNRHQLILGNDVWIGADVMLMSGVHVGNGAVIGAGAVVAKDVPPYAVVVGNPARVIKYRFDAETIERLQRIKWWNWPQEEIERHIPALNDDMEAFLDRFDVSEETEEPDETADAIRRLRAQGYTVSYFIPDFNIQVPYAVWTRVVDSFLAAYTAQDPAALVLAIPNGKGVDAYTEAIAARVAEMGERAPLILTHRCGGAQPFSVAALKASDAYITTREPVCSYAVDYAADAHLPIRYGLDAGRLVFPPL